MAPLVRSKEVSIGMLRTIQKPSRDMLALLPPVCSTNTGEHDILEHFVEPKT